MKGEQPMSQKSLVKKAVETPMVNREITRNPEHFIQPAVDILESQEELKVIADVPGVNKEGLQIKVENGILTLEGKMDYTSRQDTLFREFAPVTFFRQFEISEAIDPEKIQADLKNGVLTVKLPKAEERKPRQIPITIS